jgi:hypothetical protein
VADAADCFLIGILHSGTAFRRGPVFPVTAGRRNGFL